MMMALGTFIFETRTMAYQNLQRNTQQRWSAANRIGKRPAQQYVGQGEETINLPGVLYPELAGVKAAHLNHLREMAKTGEPFLLIDGEGYLHGNWIIVSIEENQSVFMRDGKSRKIAFTISLKNYGDEVEYIYNR